MSSRASGKRQRALAAVVAAVSRAGIAPERFAGGHGTVGECAPLAALATSAASR